MLDGQSTMAEVWNAAVEQLGDDAPSQDEVIQLLSQLHAADLLLCEVNPDSAELFQRFARYDKGRRRSNWKNPFSIRIPLWNPDAFLTRSLPLLKPFFNGFGVFFYCAIVGAGIVFAVVHWPELNRNMGDRILAADNLILLWLCFPVVKLLHELGHAYATRAGGGEVHEMGIMLLVFTPVPYVDATAANGFRSKWSRVLVGAAGMLTELFIAALCMFVWVAAEPGLIRSIAFNTMVIAGVSTIVFNGNPLLRFDGYYILSDLIESPNLALRGNQYWRYLAERYAFRMPRAEAPLATPGERRWFLFYTPAALVYRIFVLIAIVLYIAGTWFLIGIALALWGVATMFLLPLAKLVHYLFSLPRTAGARKRALTTAAAALLVLLVFVMLVPMPLRLQAEGVVWLPEESNVRAGAEGYIQRVFFQSGAQVAAGTALVESGDPILAAELKVIEARIAELEAKLRHELFSDRVQAEITKQVLAHERARQARGVDRADKLFARASIAGRFVIDGPDDLIGRFHRQGNLLGYVIHEAPTIVRVVVSQEDVDLVRSRLRQAEVRLAERIEDVHPAHLVRAVPAAHERLPSTALSTEGGGVLATDPRDPKGEKSLASTFQFDLQLPPGVGSVGYGGRAHVRFVLEPEPLGRQWYRRVRQLFLSQFNV